MEYKIKLGHANDSWFVVDKSNSIVYVAYSLSAAMLRLLKLAKVTVVEKY